LVAVSFAACSTVKYNTTTGGAMNLNQMAARYERQMNSNREWRSDKPIRFVDFVLSNPIANVNRADALVEVRVLPRTGDVLHVHLIETNNDEWGSRVMAAVKRWRFAPFDTNGSTEKLAIWWLPISSER
jgi:hypothetical protein